MIAKLTGEVIYRGVSFVIVECHDVGYQVMFPEEVVRGLSGTVSVFAHEVIRENERELFGFLSIDALELFWRLIRVSGVGPRSGQKIVFAASVREVRDHIMKGNIAFFKGISGIGMKTAQKIILELKGELTEAPVAGASIDPDALEALVGLGYPRKQSEEILAMIDAESSEERVTKALKMMGR